MTRARVEVNNKKLSSDERAQFQAAQSKEMDQWISNDVISVCQGAGNRFTHGKWLKSQEKRSQKPVLL